MKLLDIIYSPGKHLRSWRVLRGYKQSQVRAKTGMSIPRISQVETGVAAPNYEMIKWLVEETGAMDEIYEFRDEVTSVLSLLASSISKKNPCKICGNSLSHKDDCKIIELINRAKSL